MKIVSSDLLNLPVYTQSGQNLGRINSFEVDIDNHAIIFYQIKTGLIKGLLHEQLTVHPSQVVSVSLEKMVVKDNVVKESQPNLATSSVVK